MPPPTAESTPSEKSPWIKSGLITRIAAAIAVSLGALVLSQTKQGKEFLESAVRGVLSDDNGMPKWSPRQKEYLQQRARAEGRPDIINRQWKVALELGRHLCEGRMDTGFLGETKNDQKFAHFIIWDPQGPSISITVKEVEGPVEYRGVPGVRFQVTCKPDGTVEISSQEGMKSDPGSLRAFLPPDFGIDTNTETWTWQSRNAVLATLRSEAGQRPPRTDNPHTWLPIPPGQEAEDIALDYLRLVLQHYESREAESPVPKAPLVDVVKQRGE